MVRLAEDGGESQPLPEDGSSLGLLGSQSCGRVWYHSQPWWREQGWVSLVTSFNYFAGLIRFYKEEGQALFTTTSSIYLFYWHLYYWIYSSLVLVLDI